MNPERVGRGLLIAAFVCGVLWVGFAWWPQTEAAKNTDCKIVGHAPGLLKCKVKK